MTIWKPERKWKMNTFYKLILGEYRRGGLKIVFVPNKLISAKLGSRSF
jgi:hypothetical protein